MTPTKKLYLLPDGSATDLAAQLDAPLRSITSEHLARIEALEAEPQTLFARGAIKTGYSYAPIKEGVPDIPERPTVIVETEPIDTSRTMVAVIWLAAIAAGLLVGYGVWAGVVSLRGI